MGLEYRGTMKITESGKPCKDWTLMKTWADSYPKSGLVGPFCRFEIRFTHSSHNDFNVLLYNII